MNKVILLGNLGADPEPIQNSKNLPIVKMRLATTERWKDQERTEWHSLKAFGKTAEYCMRNLTKGCKIMIEGKIKSDSYEKDGIKRKTYEVIIDTVQNVVKSPNSQGHYNSQAYEGTSINVPPQMNQPEMSLNDAFESSWK
jgi:single-strand DNA-binding protein